jgi:hypothetical protein
MALSQGNPGKPHFDPLFTTFWNYTREDRVGSTVFRFPNNDLAANLQQLSFRRIKRYLGEILQVSSEVSGRANPTTERTF